MRNFLFHPRDDVLTEGWGHDLLSLYEETAWTKKKKFLPWRWYTELRVGGALNKWWWRCFQGHGYHDGPHNIILGRRWGRDGIQVPVGHKNWLGQGRIISKYKFINNLCAYFSFLECRRHGSWWVGFETTRHQESIAGTAGFAEVRASSFRVLRPDRSLHQLQSGEALFPLLFAAQTLPRDWEAPPAIGTANSRQPSDGQCFQLSLELSLQRSCLSPGLAIRAGAANSQWLASVRR